MVASSPSSPAVAVFVTLSLAPARSGAAGDTWPARLGAGGIGVARVSGNGQPFDGIATVGALFGESSGKLSSHFCTASVVDSPHGDLAITAAHCVTGTSRQMVFVPGYANGTEPYGVWQVTRVYTDAAWQSAQDPDDDVAFLQLSGRAWRRAGRGRDRRRARRHRRRRRRWRAGPGDRLPGHRGPAGLVRELDEALQPDAARVRLRRVHRRHERRAVPRRRVRRLRARAPSSA